MEQLLFSTLPLNHASPTKSKIITYHGQTKLIHILWLFIVFVQGNMRILFEIVIKVFQFLGMWPIFLQFSSNSPNTKRFCNAFLVIWSIINILSLSTYIILLCVYYELVLNKLKGIGQFSAASKGGTVLITHLIILLESLYTRSDQELLWSKVQSVRRIFEQMRIPTADHNDAFYKNYFFKFFSYQVLMWTSEITVLCLVQDNVSWMLFIYATLFSVMVSRSRHLHHALYIGGFYSVLFIIVRLGIHLAIK